MLTLLQTLALMPWLLASLLVGIRLLRGLKIREWSVEPPADSKLVSIVVPARDEARWIGAAVATMLDSSYRAREVVVIDDGSIDGTADVARVLAQRSEGALRVLVGRTPPPDWDRVTWVMAQGVDAAKGELLLFTHGDVRHFDEVLARGVNALEDLDVAAVGLLPRRRAVGWGESLAAAQLRVLFSVLPRAFGVAKGTDGAGVGGEFFLIRRSALDAIGGLASLSGEQPARRIAERLAAIGEPVALLSAERELEAQPRGSVDALTDAWTPYLRLTLWRRIAAIAWLLLFWWVPVIGLIGSIFGQTSAHVAAWATGATTLSIIFWIAVHARLRLPPLRSLLFPVGALLVAIALIRRRSPHRTPR